MSDHSVTCHAKYFRVEGPKDADLTMSFRTPGGGTVNVIISVPLALMLDAQLGSKLGLPSHEFADAPGEDWLPTPDEIMPEE